MTAPIIDADEYRAGRHNGNLRRSNEGRTWWIVGTMGNYYQVLTKGLNGINNVVLIPVTAYQRADQYISQIPKYKYPVETPIIDADTEQARKAEQIRQTMMTPIIEAS